MGELGTNSRFYGFELQLHHFKDNLMLYNAIDRSRESQQLGSSQKIYKYEIGRQKVLLDGDLEECERTVIDISRNYANRPQVTFCFSSSI